MDELDHITDHSLDNPALVQENKVGFMIRSSTKDLLKTCSRKAFFSCSCLLAVLVFSYFNAVIKERSEVSVSFSLRSSYLISRESEFDR